MKTASKKSAKSAPVAVERLGKNGHRSPVRSSKARERLNCTVNGQTVALCCKDRCCLYAALNPTAEAPEVIENVLDVHVGVSTVRSWLNDWSRGKNLPNKGGNILRQIKAGAPYSVVGIFKAPKKMAALSLKSVDETIRKGVIGDGPKAVVKASKATAVKGKASK